MKFGPLSTVEAEGAVLAHTAHLSGGVLKKGRVLSAQDIGCLAAAGIAEIFAARYENGDVAEDVAVGRAASQLAGPGVHVTKPFTGRCNLLADARGLLVLERAAIDALNRIDESITLATLSPFRLVEPGQMVATVKVIPFAASDAAVAAWECTSACLSVAPFVPHRIGLVQTLLPGIKPSVMDKAAALTRQRIEALGSDLIAELRCPHATQPIAEAIAQLIAAHADLVLVAGASAMIDRRDVVPSAILAAHGVVEHFGMPVDPGNLLLLGSIGTVQVLGMPGCARSPKPNGLDWVLQRLLAKIPLGSDEIMAMGVGGLLAAENAE